MQKLLVEIENLDVKLMTRTTFYAVTAVAEGTKKLLIQHKGSVLNRGSRLKHQSYGTVQLLYSR